MQPNEVPEIISDMNIQTDFRVAHEINQLSISTLTPLEIDFFFAFVSDIRKDDENIKRYVISKEVMETKLKRRMSKSRIETLLKRMLGKQIWIKNDDEIKGYNIFATLGYHLKDEEYNVLFNPDLKPFLLKLDTFILGNTKYLFALDSKYQKQMYLLMSQWKKRGKYTTKVDALMESMKVPESMKRWSEFKIKVLDASAKAFFEKSDVIFEWKVTKKKGKKIDEITFTIQDNPHFKKDTGLFDAEEMRTGYEEFYGKKIQTKQGIFTIVRVESIGNEIRVFFQENQEGYASLPNIEALKKAIKITKEKDD
jgi:plasmid replication initiation protein